MGLTTNNAKKNLKPVLKGEEEEKGGGGGQGAGIKVDEAGRRKDNFPNEFLVLDKNFHGEGNPRARTQNNWF